MNKVEQEQLRQTLSQIRAGVARKHEEAARKKAVFLRKQEEERQRKEEERQREVTEQKLVDKNWSLVKRGVLEFFGELNREVLDGKGKIGKWRRNETTGLHHHLGVEGNRGTSWTGLSVNVDKHETFLDLVELNIRGLGKIVVFRPIGYRVVTGNYPMKGYDGWGFQFSTTFQERSSEYYSAKEIKMGRNVYAGFLTHADEYQVLCPECTRFEEGVVSLTEPLADLNKKVRNAISDQLVNLHKEALLR